MSCLPPMNSVGLPFPTIPPPTGLRQHLVLCPFFLHLVASRKVFCFSQILRPPECRDLPGTMEPRFLKGPEVDGCLSAMPARAPESLGKVITHPGSSSALPPAQDGQGQPSIPLIRPLISSFICLSQASLCILNIEL